MKVLCLLGWKNYSEENEKVGLVVDTTGRKDLKKAIRRRVERINTRGRSIHNVIPYGYKLLWYLPENGKPLDE